MLNESNQLMPARKSRKVLVIVISIAAVLIIAVGVVLALKFFHGSANVDKTSNSDLDQTATASALESQLKAAYEVGVESSGEVTFISDPVVQDSPMKGYKIARVYVPDTNGVSTMTALFYQASDQRWVFFKVAASQNVILCSDYDSDDLISAFTGFTCQDEAGEDSFVSHPSSVDNLDEPAGGSGG